MGHPCLIALVLTSMHMLTTLSISTSLERNSPKNFRRHISPAAPTDWENGLREAVYQMLIREGYTHPNLREYLSIAPILGQRNPATPFGDIAVLARGQLYLTNAGFVFIQDPNSYDCDECDEHEICGSTNCQWSKPQNYGTLLALWTTKRIRHHDRNYGHRFEVQYIISPAYSTSRDSIVLKNGIFNYGIAGHVFILKDKTYIKQSVPYQTLEQRSCKWCDDQGKYMLPHVTTQNHNNDRQYLPPRITVTEINSAHLKGGFLIGAKPNGGKYFLQPLPNQDETRSYQEEANMENNLQREIELYTRLLQSLARQMPQTESSQYITTTEKTSKAMTTFVPNTMPLFVTNPVSSTAVFEESPSTERNKPVQKVTVPYQQTMFIDFTTKSQRPKTSSITPKHFMATTPSTRQYSKITTLIRFPATKTTPFRASPNYVKYSEPDPLYHPTTDIPMYLTPRKQFSVKTTPSTRYTTKQKLLNATSKIYVTEMKATTPSVFPQSSLTTRIFEPIIKMNRMEPTISTIDLNESNLLFETKQTRESTTDRQTLPLDTTRLEVTPSYTESNKITQSLINKTTDAFELDQETTTELKMMFNEEGLTVQNKIFIIKDITTMIPSTEKILSEQEEFSTPHTTVTATNDEFEHETTTIIPSTREIIEETEDVFSVPQTTMTASNDDYIKYKPTMFATELNEKNLHTLPTTEDFNTQQTTVFTTQESKMHKTSLPSMSSKQDITIITPETTNIYTEMSVSETENLTITTEIPTAMTMVNSKITIDTEMNTDITITKTEKEVDLLDEIFGTVVTDNIVKSTTIESTTRHKNTKEIDELFDDEIVSKEVSDSEGTAKDENVKIIFSNFYLASSAEPTTTEITTDTLPYTQETEMSDNKDEFPESTAKENVQTTTFSDQITEHTTQPVTVPTSQSYSTSISFEVNKRNKSLNIVPDMNNEKIHAKLTEVNLNDTEFMIYKAELPDKKIEPVSVNNTFDAIALSLVNHARSIDYVNKKHNGTKPKRKYRKYKHRSHKKIT